MKISPYTITFGGKVSYYCKALFDDGRVADLFSPEKTSGLEWEAMAAAVEEREVEELAAKDAAVVPETPAKDSKALIQESIDACYAEKLIAAPTLEAFKTLVSKLTVAAIAEPTEEPLEKP